MVSMTCVNALHRASPISTEVNHDELRRNQACQCPTSGFSHFYDSCRVQRKRSWLCQCPTSGFSHFYILKVARLIKALSSVSMPYIGLLPFLPVQLKGEKDEKYNVSMPYIGLLPFLQYPLKNLIKSMVSGTVFRG